MHNLKTIIFDMDGTLADTEEIHRQAFNAAFDKYDIPCHWDQELYKSLLSTSGGRERIYKYFVEHKLVPGQAESASKFAVKIHKTKSEIYRQKLIDGHVGLRPGIQRLIEEARDHDINLAIATSSSFTNVDTLLKSNLGNDALTLFETIVSSDIIEEKKPSPAVYKQVLRELGQAPGLCVALEDTLNGNKSALAADIITVITTHIFTLADIFNGASLVINHLGEPELPMTVQSGDAFGAKFVNIELLQQILQNNHQLSRYNDTPAVAVE